MNKEDTDEIARELSNQSHFTEEAIKEALIISKSSAITKALMALSSASFITLPDIVEGFKNTLGGSKPTNRKK